MTFTTDLNLAVTQFYQLAYMIVVLFPQVQLRISGEDEDIGLQGLSLYLDEDLALVLQPAGRITRNPMKPTLATLPTDSFETSAPLVLEALLERKNLPESAREAVSRSSVAGSFERDRDAGPFAFSLAEDDVAGAHTKATVQAVWKSIREARVLVAYNSTF